MNNALSNALDSMRDYKPWKLANMADCGSPDSTDSPGASMLQRVLWGFIEAVEYAAEDYPEYGPADMAEHVREMDAAHETADGAPSVYTYELWKQFVDLSAWEEDPIGEYGIEDSADMLKLASMSLYMIASRLFSALADELSEYADDSEDDSEDDSQ